MAKTIKGEPMFGGGRSCNVEIVRFLGILLIMGHHLYLIGLTDNYIFKNCWVWVDFFFALTGAFTYKHFAMNSLTTKSFGCEALTYTYRKFVRFFPLTVLSVIIMYFITYRDLLCQGDWHLFFATAAYSPFEMVYLSSSGIVRALNAPLWFLSAMFIVLPVIVFLIQMHEELWKVVSFCFPIVYFGYKGVNTDRAWPNDIIRAFACMALGTMSYILAMKIRGYIGIVNHRRIIFSIIEVGSASLAVYISAFNKECINLMEPLFVILIALLLSQSTLTAIISNKIIVVLGKMSMPMFIFHWCIGCVCNVINDMKLRVLTYYMGTIAIGGVVLIMHYLFQLWRGKNEL